MEDKYEITREQLEDLMHYNAMFEFHAGEIADLCSEERSDIQYGFVLGQTHNYLRDHYMNMSQLMESIINKDLEEPTD